MRSLEDGRTAFAADHVLTCIECGRLWVQPEERWRLYVTDDEQPERLAYCQACAEREFDGD